MVRLAHLKISKEGAKQIEEAQKKYAADKRNNNRDFKDAT